MKILIFVIAYLSANIFSQQGYAADLSKPQQGGICYGTSKGFDCEHLGRVTIRQIYEKGWRVVAYIKEGDNVATLIIEEQR